MFKKPLLKEIFWLALGIAFMHYMALKLYLYWTTDWFDIIMHFAGGLLIGLLAAFVFYTSQYIKFPHEHRGAVLATILSSVLIIGLGWELWELFLGWTDVLADRGDTALDLVMDILGGFCAVGYASKYIVWNNKLN